METPSKSRTVVPEPVAPLKNRYFVCPGYQDECIPWEPQTGNEKVDIGHLAYLGGVFEAMEDRLDEDDLTVYVTWKLDELPSYGPDVVAVVLGDEWGRYPLYTNRTRAVFKMDGTDLPLEIDPFRTPGQLSAVTAAKYVRLQPERIPHLVRAWRDRWSGPSWTDGAPVPIFDIPLGYVYQDDLPIKPLGDRAYDMYFSGSISNKVFPWYTPQFWLRTPKDVARSRMVDAMRELSAARPDLRIEIDTRSSYVPVSKGKDKEAAHRSYSEMMMDTRICPVPRGTRLETARLYEALRYGCVVVSEPLPDRWFTRGLPGVVLHDWAKMPDVVTELLDDPDRLDALHRASLDWWKTKCSEEAVGHFMADKLRALFGGERPAQDRAADTI